MPLSQNALRLVETREKSHHSLCLKPKLDLHYLPVFFKFRCLPQQIKMNVLIYTCEENNFSKDHKES